MQSTNENSHHTAGGLLPPGAGMHPAHGYAYNPLLGAQTPMYASAPHGPYKVNQNHMDELATTFAGLKPLYPGVHAGMQNISHMPYHDGRNGFPSRGSGASLTQNPYMMPQVVSYSTMAPLPGQYLWNGMPHDNADVPPLARRNSASSNEEVGPQTPFVAGQFSVDQFKKSAGVNIDPSQAWSTPSPYSLTYGTSMPQQLWKSDGEYSPVDYESLCTQVPPIPRPVPAIFSSEKSRGTLDKCLKNDTNTTNVYIRGLHPNTTDEMLEAYGARFGDIMSAKSMLDQATGACKGFGFIKYHNFDDGENCIRGFFHLGYEAKWARVSHNERLKTLADEGNTNLYISNLPMSYNEQMLTSTFGDYEVMSAKILRDENGISRGVGFARFGSPSICADVIAKYNNVPIMEGYNLSIRFADTPEQKKLKSLTAERRQFKTHEYNTAAYGPGSPYASTASPIAGNFPSPVNGRFPSSPYTAYVAAPGHEVSVSPAMPNKATENMVPSSVMVHNAAARTESPSISAQSKRVVNSQNRKSTKTDIATLPEEETSTPLKNVTNVGGRLDKRISPSKSAVESGSPARQSSRDIGARTTPSKTPRSKRY